MNRRAKAFTLVEVVLAIALSLGLMATMLWFYNHAGEVRDSVTEEIQQITARRRMMDRLTNELRSSLAYDFLNIGMEGQIDSVTFITAVLPGQAAWAVRNAVEDPIPPEQDLQMVTYGLQILEDDDGQQYINGLEAQTQKIVAAPDAEEGKEITTSLLSPYVLFVRFRYWDGEAWVEEWQDGSLPGAVEIAIGSEPLPENVEPIDYPYELNQRVVFIPTAINREKQGGTIRGLPGAGGAG